MNDATTMKALSPLETLCQAREVTISCEYLGEDRMNADSMNTEDEHVMKHWKVTLRLDGRRLVVDFWQGLGHSDAPTAADVLCCVVSDARSYEVADSFVEWASGFGYDSDSRAAERIYKACGKLAPRVKKFLGDAFDDFANAEH